MYFHQRSPALAREAGAAAVRILPGKEQVTVMAKAKSPSEESEPSFESAMGRLEEIVGTMEAEKLPLEDLLLRYEEGVKLVRFCTDKLASAEQRIEIITRDAAGKPALAPFAEGTAPRTEAGEPQDVRLF